MYGYHTFGVTYGDERRVFSKEFDGSVLGNASIAVESTSASWMSPSHVMSASYSRPIVVNGSWYESWGGSSSASFVSPSLVREAYFSFMALLRSVSAFYASIGLIVTDLEYLFMSVPFSKWEELCLNGGEHMVLARW